MLALDNNYLRDYFNDTGLFGGEKITDESLANPSILQVTNLTRVFLTKTRFHPTAMDCVLHLIQHMSPVDWLLFLNKPDYREHRFHQFRVALVALWLFDQITKGRLDIRYPRDKVAGALWVAAILHDHGLALSRFAQLRPCLTSGGDTGLTGSGAEMLARLRGCYEGLYAVSLVREYCDACDAVPPADEPARDQSESVRATLRRYLEQVGMDEPFLIRLSGDDEKLYDHGLWSAVNLSASLCQFGMPWRFVADEDRDLIRMVIHAMAVHNREDFRGEDFSLDRNPIAGLLFLADVLQEWDRIAVPTFGPMDIVCQVSVKISPPSEMRVCFTYCREHLKRAGWLEGMAWKKQELQRISGAQGLPKIQVDIDYR